MTKSLKGPKGLEEWARRVTEGYPNVCIKDLTHSWRNGLAFCAIIHRFRPDLINFDSLSEKDVYENNRLAFNVAEKHLKVPALLDPEDMEKVQDKCSIALYLSELYQVLEIKRDLRPSLPPSLSSS